MADRMKRGEHRNIISDDELVWEHAGGRLGGMCFHREDAAVFRGWIRLTEERLV